jgi:hypothetical protein
MDCDKDKVDDMVLALLWLTTFGEKQLGQIALRAWKGHDWDALNWLHEKGFGRQAVPACSWGVAAEEGKARRLTYKRLELHLGTPRLQGYHGIQSAAF